MRHLRRHLRVQLTSYQEMGMINEEPTEREKQEFDGICDQFDPGGHYDIIMKRNWSNQSSFRTVTVRDRKSGAVASYYADSPPDSPKIG